MGIWELLDCCRNFPHCSLWRQLHSFLALFQLVWLRFWKRKSQTTSKQTKHNVKSSTSQDSAEHFHQSSCLSPTVFTHCFHQASYPEKLKSTLRLSMQMLSSPQFISKSSCENSYIVKSHMHVLMIVQFIWKVEKVR